MTDLPESKYSKPIHTPGKEFELDGREYVGWYLVTYLDQYFAGKTLTENSKEIFPILKQTLFKNNVFVQQIVSPNSTDRLKGVWKRYLIQKINTLSIIEVNKVRYDSFGTTPGFRKLTVDWTIKGPAQDVVKNTYRYSGADNKNKQTVTSLENIMPGISSFLKNYSEFVE